MFARRLVSQNRIQALKDLLKIVEFPNRYEEHYQRATNDLTMEDFWAEQASLVEWFKEPESILDSSRSPFYKWFKGGLLNNCYNCIDRHLKERPNAQALIYESAMTNTSKYFTYKEMHDHVSRLAGVLQKHGVRQGDRVVIYMPMIPEAVMSMLACARIGAIHSVVFGGFGGPELASRVRDCKAKVILSASCGIEPNNLVDYKKNLDKAAQLAGIPGLKKIIVQRMELPCEFKKGEDFDYYEELSSAQSVEAVPVDATDFLYILYTSGTTGSPKGVVRDNGGNAVAVSYTMKHLMGFNKGDTYFASSDIGWVVGHCFIVYGPLLMGGRTVLYEGKPVGTPDAGQLWRIIDKYKVQGLYTSPTALRSLKREDPNGEWLKKFDLSTLKMCSVGGERMDIPAYHWLRKHLDPKVLINDNYWQTETGWMISSNFLDLHHFPERGGSAGKPCPGMRITSFGEDGKEKEPGQPGKLCIKLPMPPGFAATLYEHDEGFVQKYLKEHPGYYTTGDAGYLDKDGYLHVVTRVDDVINCAGHRLSTSQMEEILTHHPDIVEAAVVGARDEIKGEIPVGFVVLRGGITRDREELEKECIKRVRHDIGPVASFKKCIVVEKLPKTRSGKIVRNVLKALVNGNEVRIPPTIEDASIVDVIGSLAKEYGLGRPVDIEYEEDVSAK